MSAGKQSESFPGRTFYHGSGVHWTLFIPWFLLALAVAAILAVGMFQLFRLGHYYVVIVPILAALLVALMIKLAVGKGHCRSPWVGGAAGVLAGLVLYLGYFYFGMIYQLGPETATHPELLPYYLRARMMTDVIRDAAAPSHDEESPREHSGNSWFNWGTLAFEAIAVLAFTTLAGVQRSRKAYCPTCQQWMVREVTHFDPTQSAELLEVFRTGSARSLAALCAKPVHVTVPNTTLAVEFCPSAQDGRARDCAVYASMKNVTQGSGTPTTDPFDSAKGKVVLRSLQLNPDELAALGARFKVFETIAGRAAVAALRPAESAAETSEAKPGTFAEIKPIEPEYAGKVLTRRTALLGNALVFAGLLLIFAGIGLAAWGGSIAFPDKHSPQDVPPARKAAGIAVLTLGLVCFAGTAIFFFINPSYFGNRYVLKRMRLEFSRRPKCLVDPNDPEARFVEIVPKLNWGKLMLESASDAGFLKLDRRRREILFEGDKQRWRIPAETITHCAVEVHVEGQGTHAATKVYFVVLRARQPGQFWEAPIRERTGTGKLRSGRRKKAAFQLFETIESLRGDHAGRALLQA